MCEAVYRAIPSDVRDDQLTISNAFRDRVVNRVSPIVRIVVINFEFIRFRGPSSTIWVFVDGSGRGTLRIYPELWQREDLERLRAELDVPLQPMSRRPESGPSAGRLALVPEPNPQPGPLTSIGCDA